MKKLLLIVLMVCLSSPAFAYQRENQTKAQKALKLKADQVEIIEGTPKRKFVKIQPVLAYGGMDAAVKYIKKMTAKVGGNAVIQVETGTEMVSSSAGGLNSLFGYYGSSTAPVPFIKGWAVRWVD